MSDHDLINYIKVYEEQLPVETCEDIIQRFEAAGKEHLHRNMRNIRAFTELNFERLPDSQDLRRELEAKAHACLKRYRQDCKGVIPGEYEFEHYRIERYQPEAGHLFGRHVDNFGGLSVLRFLVLFWYLNDVEEGGGTWFPELKLRIRPRRGRVLMFPPYWMYEHAGLAPVSGPKYIVGSYLPLPRPRDLVEE